MIDMCDVCKHPDDHPPRETDNGIKPPFCPECKRCRERRKSLKDTFPPGFASIRTVTANQHGRAVWPGRVWIAIGVVF